jgi:hypothetical protein
MPSATRPTVPSKNFFIYCLQLDPLHFESGLESTNAKS